MACHSGSLAIRQAISVVSSRTEILRVRPRDPEPDEETAPQEEPPEPEAYRHTVTRSADGKSLVITPSVIPLIGQDVTVQWDFRTESAALRSEGIPGYPMIVFYKFRKPEPDPASSERNLFQIQDVTRNTSDQSTEIVCSAFDLGDEAVAWVKHLPEAPGWHVLAAFDAAGIDNDVRDRPEPAEAVLAVAGQPGVIGNDGVTRTREPIEQR